MYIDHPLLAKNEIEYREYQVRIARACLQASTLVVLPTGMGKTVIALLIIAEVLRKKGPKVLFMAPTKPLVEQHAEFLNRFLNYDGKISVLTGEVTPRKRAVLWQESAIIVSTPQVVKNDLEAGRISLDGINLAIFDEAHRAVGEYSYVYIGELCKKRKILRMGMTASPGSEASKIMEVCRNLGIENIEIRSKYDPDVAPYAHDIKIEWVRVQMPKGYESLVKHLKEAYRTYIRELKAFGLLKGKPPSVVGAKDLIVLGEKLREEVKNRRHTSLYRAMTLQAAAMKLNHAIELAETQGIEALREYMEKLIADAKKPRASKADKEVLKNENVKVAIEIMKDLAVQHPKLEKVVEIVSEQLRTKPESRIIVFTHYRDTAELVTSFLSRLEGVRPVRFVGQASRGEHKGMRQREQVEVVKKFRAGAYNVLVATSVAEEGLDIPATDLVVFYEPIPSEIRTIQRRGRTGRKGPGRVVILITKRTRDEAYYWSSRRKEKKMHAQLMRLKEELKKIARGEVAMDMALEVSIVRDTKKTEKRVQTTLFDFFNDCEDCNAIYVDYREANSGVVEELESLGMSTVLIPLSVGDYLISKDVCVERKNAADFASSIIDGRLFEQAKKIKEEYQKPLIIVEGNIEKACARISRNAFFGALASLLVDYSMPVIFTKNCAETAQLIASIARRERAEGRMPRLRVDKKKMNIDERIRYVVEGLPNISSIMAERLLQRFGTVRAIANASEGELKSVRGIGDKTAKEILRVLTTKYGDEEDESRG